MIRQRMEERTLYGQEFSPCGSGCGQSEDLRVGVAKGILSELFDIMTHEVDEMIRQRIDERTLNSREFVV
ncbi:MAG: hypothetical protein LUQ38_04110 [Methanotrichaceae archaeon]|nr:hypothetical protein [Methanotrichaceae archaeon]